MKANNQCFTNSSLSFVNILEDYRDVRILAGQSNAPEVIVNISLKDVIGMWEMPTIRSELIDCEYFLKVELGFNNRIESKSYDMQIAIEVCNGRQIITNRFSPQPELNVMWSPTMLSMEPIQVRIYDHVQPEGKDNLNLNPCSHTRTELIRPCSLKENR